jgi:hypothetical protein
MRRGNPLIYSAVGERGRGGVYFSAAFGARAARRPRAADQPAVRQFWLFSHGADDQRRKPAGDAGWGAVMPDWAHSVSDASAHWPLPTLAFRWNEGRADRGMGARLVLP